MEFKNLKFNHKYECEEYFFEEYLPNKEYVKYGKDNLTPNKLITLFENSGVHSSIVKGITDLIAGSGIEVVNNTFNPFLKTANPDESLFDLIKKCAYDLKIFGGFYLNIIRSKYSTKIAHIYHIPFQNVRAKAENGKITGYYYSWEWHKIRNKKKFIPKSNFNLLQENSILPVFSYTPGQRFYPKPDYNGSIRYIELDTEISNFHLNNIKNGMTSSFWINFNNGIPSQEEAIVVRRKLEKEMTGGDNAGQMVVTFSDGVDTAPSITPLTAPNNDKMFVEIANQTLQNIIVAHRVSPNLIGVMVAGKLGSDNPIENYEVLNKTVIQPYQTMIESAFNRLFNYNELGDIKINELKIILPKDNETIDITNI